tara:strand:- start:2401 stop:3270 length:870 start_codon:yes stop_codon:yes gene_type:complete
MKGIILAGGAGTRLYPLTIATSKQLMPVFDKPMIYYPLSVLMLLNIKDVLIISTDDDIPRFEKLLGDGKKIGMNFQYKVQKEPKGIAEAFLIGEKFIGDDSVSLILGDNVFYGSGWLEKIRNSIKSLEGGLIFGYEVKNPREYGVVDFDSNFKVTDIEEKPQNPKTAYAVPGLYFYDNQVVSLVRKINPSERGELEITDLNKAYLSINQLQIQLLGRGITWFDTGTHHSLMEAANFVQSIEQRQGLKIACIEEIALHMNFIDKKQFSQLIQGYKENEYKKYLHNKYLNT